MSSNPQPDYELEGHVEEQDLLNARMELEALREAYDDLKRGLILEGEQQKARLQEARKAESERIIQRMEDERKKSEEARQKNEVICQELRQASSEEGRRQGYEIGYEEGLQKGLEESRRVARENTERAAKEILGDSCDTLPATLAKCLDDFDRAWRETVSEMRRDTVALSRGIAERIIRRELDQLPQLVLENIEVAVQRISDRRRLCIEVHPADLEAVVQFLPELGRRIRGAEAAEVVGQEFIQRGGCRIQSETGQVDLRIDTQLDLIESALIRNTQVSG
ncbi:MAG: hypothetical protein CBC13_09745 [Planctomycetia bacterium TMED53]|nr:MAG: hypothetical protein CBC13_09745 [Planctomycetia bacterium TMED53]